MDKRQELKHSANGALVVYLNMNETPHRCEKKRAENKPILQKSISPRDENDRY